jgi:hypothetical protein
MMQSEPHITLWPDFGPWIPPIDPPMRAWLPPTHPMRRENLFLFPKWHKTQPFSSFPKPEAFNGSSENFGQGKRARAKRGSWDRELELNGSNSAVPDGLMAVWNGRVGELGLHLGAPALHPSANHPGVSNFPRTMAICDWSSILEVLVSFPPRFLNQALIFMRSLLTLVLFAVFELC